VHGDGISNYSVTEMELNKITEKIIGCGIEVHRELGAGLLESIYESALCIELKNHGLKYERQKTIPVEYKGCKIGEFRIDLLVENSVVVELKSVERFDPVFEAQILSYMKLGNYKIGLLMNFNSRLLKDGIKRYII
jgi:GxxExxY protein